MYSFCHHSGEVIGDSAEQSARDNGLSICTEWEQAARASIVHVIGSVNWTTSPDLRLEIAQCLAVGHPAQIILDLKGVDRVDSSGVGTLLESWQNATSKGVQFTLCGINDSVRRMLERIRLDGIFQIRATPTEALPDTAARKSI